MPNRKLPLPVTVVAAFSAAFGLTKGMFALHLLAAATVLGAAVGPYTIIALSIADTIIGFGVAVAGIFLVWRRRWALELVRVGWVPLIAYEVGRALGMANARPGEVNGYDVGMSVILLLCFLLVWKCLRVPSVDAYVQGSAASSS